MYEMPEERPTGMAALMQDPMFTLGASLLASAGGQAGPVGRGLMGGIAGYQAQQSNNTLQEYRRAQAEEARRKAIAEQMRQVQRQRLIAQFPPQLQALAEASPELFDKVIERQMGLNTPWYVTPEGIDPRALEYARAGATQVNLPPNLKEGYEYTQSPDGKVTAAPVPGGPADPNREQKPTEGQQKAAGQWSRMVGVNPEILKSEATIEKMGGVSIKDFYASRFPLTNAMVTPEYQVYQAQANEWIGAPLRYESGAAIPEPEFDRYYRTYFWIPGDRPETLEQKRRARARMEAATKAGAGRDAIDRMQREDYLSIYGKNAGATKQNDKNIPPPPPGFTEALP